jgi:hypothetical protein
MLCGETQRAGVGNWVPHPCAVPNLYRFRGRAMAANSGSFSIAKYVVQGVVKDDQGLPVEGAALHVGKEVVFTDSSGRFQVRFSKRGPFP